MDVICEACGESNRAGSEFCSHCNAFLAWDGSSPNRAAGPPAAGPPVAGAPLGAAVATPTVPLPEVTPAYAGAGGWQQYAADGPTAPQPAVGPDGYPAAVGETCPTCHRVNDPGLRFCSHCGYGFAASIPTTPGSSADPWRTQSAAAQDREARRAYRRSLPPLYRWRRVMIGLLVLVLLVGGALALGRDPGRVVRDGWYALNKRFVVVGPVTAAVEPALTVAGSDPANLVDRSVREWTMAWQPTAESACGAAPGTGEIVLTFPATRIRQIQVIPGLDKSNPQRSLQPLPRVVGVTYPGRPCVARELTNSDQDQPVLALDSGTEVTSVRIGIGSVYAGGADDAPLVSITEIVLRSYPR